MTIFSLYDLLLELDAVAGDDRTGQGFCAVLPRADATGTCGVGTAGERPVQGVSPGEEWSGGYVPDGSGYRGIVFPSLSGTGRADWRPAGSVVFPCLFVSGIEPGWRPGLLYAALPPASASGAARTSPLSSASLPPLLVAARSGAAGETAFPALRTAAVSGLGRTAAGAAAAPPLKAEAYCCSIEGPIRNQASPADITALLRIGDATLARLAASLTEGIGDPDDKALAVLRHVSKRLEYRKDTDDGGVGDAWTCAAATYFRGWGDCEDGAVLLQSLLLAAGLPQERLITVFGRIGVNREGHAWTCWKRACDERWTALEWTSGAWPEDAGADALPEIVGSPVYAHVDYALTAAAFYGVQASVDAFFPSVRADDLLLPVPACEGATNIRSDGASILFQETTLRPSMACRGETGAVGKLSPAAPVAAASGGWITSAMTAAPPECAALAGAAGRGAPAGASMAAAAGNGARSALAAPRLRLHGRGGSPAVVSGGARLRGVRARSLGLAGIAGTGRGAAGRAFGLGLGRRGLLGGAAATVPALLLSGMSFQDASAMGLCAPPTIRGRARGAADAGLYADFVFEHRREALP